VRHRKLLARKNRAPKVKITRPRKAEVSGEMTEKVVTTPTTLAEEEAKEEEDPLDLVTTKNTMLMKMDLPL
jgi:hypothetical protein